MVRLAANAPNIFSERIASIFPPKIRKRAENDGLEAEASLCVPLLLVPSTGEPNGHFEAPRSPSTFKSVAATGAGSTALWTPATGKSFRILGFTIIPAGGLAAAGQEVISLYDGSASMGIDMTVYLPIAASVANQPPICVTLPGNGYLSNTPGNVLNVNLSAAVTAGAVSVSVWGTEE